MLSAGDSGIAPHEIQLVVRSRQGEIAVPVAADGKAEFPVRADLLAGNPPVFTNVPTGKLATTLQLSIEAAPVEQFPYLLGDKMRQEVAEVLARQPLLVRLMLPSFDVFVVQFPAGAKAWAAIELSSGTTRLEADPMGRLLIPDRRDFRRHNPVVRLSQLPLAITLQPRSR